MNRRATVLVLAALLACLGVALALTVPWTVLPGADPVVDVSRDFTEEQVAREVAFHDAVRPPAYSSLVLGLVVSALLGLTPLGGRLVRSVARPLGGGWVWQVLLGTLALGVVGRVATLPLDARSEAVLRRYDLSTQDWGTWAVDVAKSVGVGAGLTALLLLAAVGAARRLPRSWHLVAAPLVALLVVGGSFAYPVVVEPVFHRFDSLPAGQLRDDLLVLADRDGVPVEDVLVADASRRTTALNAYVSGFGGTRRIVVYDTLLREAPPAEVRLVVAHELGHARERDVLVGTLLGSLAAAAGVVALALLLGWAPLLRRAGADSAGDPRVIALVLLLAGVGTLLLAPVTNLVSRRVEARADVHALRLTCETQAFVDSQRRLATTNLSDLDPNRFAYAMFATHPSAPERIALARALDPSGC